MRGNDVVLVAAGRHATAASLLLSEVISTSVVLSVNTARSRCPPPPHRPGGLLVRYNVPRPVTFRFARVRTP